MIVSHRYRFIFVKTRKTAGTSIEIALSKFCGPDDIITALGTDDELIRARCGYPGPQNYLVPYRRYGARDWLRLATSLVKPHRFPHQPRRAHFYNHIPAAKARAWLEPSVWDTYFKFCVERNPWDKAISFYYWRIKDLNPRPTLRQAADYLPHMNLSDFGRYTIDGAVAVDYIARYEHLDDELAFIARKLGLPEAIGPLPRAKAHFRTDRRHYRVVLGEPERHSIARACQSEIELLHYAW